jgi:hypothetical protein
MRRQRCQRSFVLSIALLLCSIAWAAPASAAVVDPERNSTSLTGWWWYHGVSEATVNSVASANGARVIDIEVESTAPYTFNAAFVKNTGTYARTWYWYYGLTSAGVAQRVSRLNARIVDIERYTVGGQRRFAIVMVKNTGNAAKSWWYYYDMTSAGISSRLSANNARLIDVESYSVNGQTRYSAVMIRNTGVDAKSWWWYLNVTPSFIATKLNANKARLIDLDRRSNGRFDVVMQRRGSEYWWWYYDQTATSVAKLASQNGARIVDLESYTKNGVKRFAILMLNNLNAESSRLREIMRTGLSGSSYGVYVKKVGGGAPVGLQQSTIFEPASMIKVVHHLYTMRRIQLGTGGDTLATNVDYYVKPGDTTNKDVCPDPAWESNPALKVTTTLMDALSRMMQVSDNRTTRTFQVRYGYPTINAYLDGIGATNTEFRQILGCGFNNGLRNDFTLVDAGKIYEGVSNGTLLGGSARDSFWTIMSGGGVSSTSAIGKIVVAEANALGMSAAKRNAFLAKMETRSKGGSYDICIDSSDCNPYTYIRTVGGRITIPSKSRAGATVLNDYVYGRFADGLTIPCTPKGSSETQAQAEARCSKYKKANAALNTVGSEMFRSIIKSALKTW